MNKLKKIYKLISKTLLSSSKPTTVSAVILAAGSSTRMGGESKQMIRLLGKRSCFVPRALLKNAVI